MAKFVSNCCHTPGSVTVLDVRPEQEFHAGHIRGARSIPVEELEARLKEIPKRQSIVGLLPRPVLCSC